MNYDFKIRVLEAELAHVREITEINRQHLEALDNEALDDSDGAPVSDTQSSTRDIPSGTRLAAIEAALETLTGNVNRLVMALLREHPNGEKPAQ